MRSVGVAGVIVALAAMAAILGRAEAQTVTRSGVWAITKTEWNADDEQGFREFVTAIGKSACTTTVGCLRDPANSYRDSDPKGFAFVADCADLPYMLRAYYAWKHGLPFAYIDAVSGAGDDIRYSDNSNRVLSRHSVVDDGNGIPAPTVLNDVHNQVFSATYRTDMTDTTGIPSDFYSPRIAPETIRPGTAIYDVNGHVGIVYDVDADGRIYYMDAHPDYTLTRSVYGAQFGQSPAALGGGLKNWRPIKLVGAVKRADGHLIGGHVEVAPDSAIADLSLEQYLGNVPGTNGDGPSAKFQYNNIPLGFYEYVRVAASGGKMNYNPVYELQATMRTLCNDLTDRKLFVDMAIKSGIQRKAQPRRLPDNIYGTSSAEWEIYSTPSRDARIKTAFAAFYQDMSRMIAMWQDRDPRIIYDGVLFQEDLQTMYAHEAKACVITYVNSAGATVALDFDMMMKSLFALDFDPYHCIERRWGAAGEELKSCSDDDNKRHWYEAEQRLRNQIERTYDRRMDFDIADMEKKISGSGVDAPPPVDLKALIDGIGPRVAFAGMKPVGN